jgi:phage terminase small subunit
MSDQYHILFWRDIPSVVKAKIGRKRYSKALDNRFMEAIDAAAMRTGDTNSDKYLEDWKPSEMFPIKGEPQACIDQAAQQLEEEYPRDRLVALIKNGGRES